jgi:methionine-rich copper-binding protein CopC
MIDRQFRARPRLEPLEDRLLLAVVAVDADQVVRPVETRDLGVNLAWWDNALNTSQTQALVQDAGLTLFRFPGGSSSDTYHFNAPERFPGAGTVPRFAALIEAMGGDGMVTLDYGTGSPQEAAAFLAYCNGQPGDPTVLGSGPQWSDSTSSWVTKDWQTAGYWAELRAAAPLAQDDGLNFLRISHPTPFNFTYFEIGNEVFGSWETDHHTTPHDPVTYVQFAKQFAVYARMISPNILIGADGSGTGGSFSQIPGNWTAQMLQQSAQQGFLPDFICDHNYMFSSYTGNDDDARLLLHSATDPSATSYGGPINWAGRAQAYRALITQDLGDAGAHVQLMCTEFNSEAGSALSNQSTSLVNGLWLADALGGILQTEYTGAVVWDLRNGYDITYHQDNVYGWRYGSDFGLLGVDNPNGPPPSTGTYIPYPNYFAEQLFSKFAGAGGQVVRATSDSPALAAYAVTASNGHLELLVINKNANEDVDEQFQLTGFGPSGESAVWQYGEAEDTAQSLTTDGHASLTHFTSTLSLSGASFHFTFPRYSMTVLDLTPVTGPYVVVQSPAGTIFDTVGHLLVTFDTAIDPSTFTTARITSFTRTAGATQTDLSTALLAVTPVPGSGDKEFDVSFQVQSTTGAYRLTFGPDVFGVAGEPMAQEYAATFTVRGPMIVAATPTGNSNLPNPARTARVTFNEPINPATLTPDVVWVRGPAGTVVVTTVNPVAGSNNTQFDITFPQLATGHYTVLVLPFVQDMAGHPLDQNGNLIGGELPNDIFVLEFGVQGLQVVDSATAINSTVAGLAYRVHLRFNEPVDLSSFTPAAMALTGPDGDHPAYGVVPTAGTNFTEFDALFVPLTAAGTYHLSVGPHVRDVYGNEMDQDGDLVPGEASDAYATTFIVNGPRIIATTPAATDLISAPFNHVRVTFNSPMQVFGTDQVALTDPSGNAVNVTGVAVVPFANNTQFDITFDSQTAFGAYLLSIGRGIQDVYGNPMDSAFTATYLIRISYTATPTTFQNNDIFGQDGTQVLTFTGGGVTADINYGIISLGTNSFTFYGQTYNQLFVSSKGLIAFGSPFTDYVPTNLVSDPAQAVIAAYWTDVLKEGTEPQIVWRIDGNQLTVEWYHVTTYPFGSSAAMTFQAILTLNTAPNHPGDIVFNYYSVTGSGDEGENLGVTVGIKDAGHGSVTVVEDGSTGFSASGNPDVQTGRALRFFAT